MEFKDKILKARVQLHLSQGEFAKLLGVGIASVSRWETGNSKPSKLKEYEFYDFCKKNNIKFED